MFQAEQNMNIPGTAQVLRMEMSPGGRKDLIGSSLRLGTRRGRERNTL